MYQSRDNVTTAQYKEVGDMLKHIRRLLTTKAGRRAVNREIRDKWL